jgi:phosphoribosylaminoimidazole carboxylase (NCAIR synthetase)
MTKATSINIYLGQTYTFKHSVHYNYGGKHGSMQVDMVLEKKLRVLHFYQKETRRDCHPSN